MKNLKFASLVLLLAISSDDSLAVTPSKISADPVLDFAIMIKAHNTGELGACSVMKVEADLDANGKSDYMLSSRCQALGDEYPIGVWGNAGGTWAVYLNIKDQYVLYPSVFFHPLAYHYQSVGKEGAFNLLMYWRSNADGGIYSITRYGFPYTSYDAPQNDGELIFSEEVDCEGGYAVSEKNEYLLENRKSADAIECKLDLFFDDKCVWKNSY